MPYKLLLADDSVTIQRVIELTFADEDIQVLAVGDGKKAIASIQSERPDIVLADVGMPERDGYEVAAFIKTNTELAHIPVLLLTGAFEPVDEARARAVGCDGVLVKPFEPQMVINRVKDLLAGRRSTGAWTTNGAVAPAARQPAAVAEDGRNGPSKAPAAPAGSLEDYFDRLDAAFASMESPASNAATAAAPAMPAMPAIPAAHAEVPDARPDTGNSFPQHTRHAPAATAASPVPDAIADWDPDITGDPRRPALLEPPPIELDPTRDFAPAVPSRSRTPHFYTASASAPLEPATRPLPAGLTREPAPPPAPAPEAAPPIGAAPAPPAPAPPAPAPARTPPLPAAPTLAEAFSTLLSVEQERSLAPSALATPSEAVLDDIVQRVILRMSDRAVQETVTEIAERLVREEIARIKSA